MNPELREMRPFINYRIIFLIAVIALTAYVRIRLLSVPLDRDEGEYAYMGQLLLQGSMPFKEACNMKLPGVSIVYAFFMLIFGETVTAIRLGLLITVIASCLLTYRIAQRLFDSATGTVSAASLAVLSLSPGFFGFAAHATHFVVFFSLAGLWLIFKGIDHRRIRWFWISGFCFGCGFLMKQPGIFFLLLGFATANLHLLKGKSLRNDFLRFNVPLALGFIIPVFAIIATILLSGTFRAFWFWVIRYSIEYGRIISWGDGIDNFKAAVERIWHFLPMFCVFSAAGCALACARRFSGYRTIMLFLMLLFSAIAVMPGLYFRVHYFILLIPAAGLFIGSVFFFLRSTLESRRWLKYVPAALVLFLIGGNCYTQRSFYFNYSPEEVNRRFQPGNYFNESAMVSRYVSAHTHPDDRIAVLGSEPQIYFYSKRRSATGYVYVYSLMEKQPYARKMQKEFIQDIERYRPEYLVFAKIRFSWLINRSSDPYFMQWFDTYSQKNYRTVAVIDLNDPSRRLIEGNEAEHYKPLADEAYFILKKNDGKH